MIFRRADDTHLQIGRNALLSLESQVQNSARASEAGGILLGRTILASHDVIIDRITLPTSSDSATPTSFYRPREPSQSVVNTAWSDSNGAINYLGEWHTHSELIPVPSKQDLKNWETVLRKGVYSSDSLFFLIVGQARIEVWEGYLRAHLFILEKMKLLRT